MRILFIIILNTIYFLVYSQVNIDSFTVRAYIIEKKSKVPVYNATVYIQKNDTIKTKINLSEKAFFEITLPNNNSYYITACKKNCFCSKDLIVNKNNQNKIIEDTFYLDSIEPFGHSPDEMLFDFLSSELKYNLSELDTIATAILKYPQIKKIEIGGHCDCIENELNNNLSKIRAKTIRKYLIKKGIKASRLKIKDFKDTRLVNHCSCNRGKGPGINCTEKEHSQNRRVTINWIK
jgi:outer membrane protein OmpA-like peptidoglycan-associated protein